MSLFESTITWKKQLGVKHSAGIVSGGSDSIRPPSIAGVGNCTDPPPANVTVVVYESASAGP